MAMTNDDLYDTTEINKDMEIDDLFFIISMGISKDVKKAIKVLAKKGVIIDQKIFVIDLID